MIRHILPAALLALAGTAALAAQPDEEIDCENAQTQFEMNQCAAREFAAADAKLNEQWAETSARMKALDADIDREFDKQPGHFETLLEAQRAWLTFRDAHCRAESFLGRGGSVQPMLDAFCRANLTQLRTQQLRELTASLAQR